MEKGVVDTGVLSIFFSRDCTLPVRELMNQVKNRTIQLLVMKEVLVELIRHLIDLHGRDAANTMVTSFLVEYPVRLVDLDMTLISKAGQLKSQYPAILSYIDCISIALALTMNIPFHTTEKSLKRLGGRLMSHLKPKTYIFSE